MKAVYSFILFLFFISGGMTILNAHADSGISPLKEGSVAPDFRLKNQEGKWIQLSDFKNKNWVVLYFYPKDDTPGCTKEACSFRDNLVQIQQLDAEVLGISVDSVKSHKKFSDKFNLNFSILSDSDFKVTRRYGVLTRFMGTQLANRSTYIIDPEGMIRKVFPRVDPKDHGKEIFDELQKLRKTNTEKLKAES